MCKHCNNTGIVDVTIGEATFPSLCLCGKQPTPKREIKVATKEKDVPGIRCYDNGGQTTDRYTVVFTKGYKAKTITREWWTTYYDFIHMSETPNSPQGVYMSDSSQNQPIDKPSSKHLGKRIRFDSLPMVCQLALDDEFKQRNM